MNLITLTDIRKEYRSGTVIAEVLRGISLKIEEGEFVAIMGPSGSGKSTLMNILGFLDTPSTGIYTFGGQETQDFNEDKLSEIRSEKVGFVFQSFYLLPKMNAFDNVSLPMLYAGISSKVQKERAEKALTEVGLANRMHHKPNELSGGQQQRVSIARALVNQPKVIFADEPTGNLDSASSIDIMNIFTQLHKEGKTIIMVTHEESIAEYTQRIITIRDGLIVEDKKNPKYSP
jgi:putative ABC transport system ATP-binding protein